MFAVDLREVKQNLLDKTNELIKLLTKGFEEDIIENYDIIMKKYDEILISLDKTLYTAEDVVEMNRTKTEVSLELTSVQRDIDDTYRIISYLLSVDHHFNDTVLQKIEEAIERHVKHKQDLIQ
jgi:hypothetical protein